MANRQKCIDWFFGIWIILLIVVSVAFCSCKTTEHVVVLMKKKKSWIPGRTVLVYEEVKDDGFEVGFTGNRYKKRVKTRKDETRIGNYYIIIK